MLLSAPAFLFGLSSLVALQPTTAFPIAGPSPANQVQFSRFQLKGKTLPGCYYSCPELTDEVDADAGIDANDLQGESSGSDKFTTCHYASFWDSRPIACVYDNENGRLLSSRISAGAPEPETYAGCAPFAHARNDRGRGTCMRSAATIKKEALEAEGKARLKAAQWTREKQQKRAEIIAKRME